MSQEIENGAESRPPTAEQVAPLIAARGQAIILFDNDRRAVAANAAACRLLGRSLDAIKRLRVDDLTAPGTSAVDPRHAELRWRRFLDRGCERGRWSLSVADGGVVLVDFYARANFASGAHMSVFIPVDSRSGDGTPDGNGDRDVKRGNLTHRERDVLSLVARGLTGIEIAQQLSISPPTVESHVGNAMRKLGATNRAHATAIALHTGLIDLV